MQPGINEVTQVGKRCGGSEVKEREFCVGIWQWQESLSFRSKHLLLPFMMNSARVMNNIFFKKRWIQITTLEKKKKGKKDKKKKLVQMARVRVFARYHINILEEIFFES